MIKFNKLFILTLFTLLLSAPFSQIIGQDLTESWAVRQVKSKEEAKKENLYRHKINFFFGKYWNVSSERLKIANVKIKNLKASGKLAKAKKLSESAEYHSIKLADLKERAYIANEYGLFSVDYAAETGYDQLNSRERIFVEKAIYRSLSGPVSNRIGYKNLLKTDEGQDRLRGLLRKVISDYQSSIRERDYFNSLDLPEDIRVLVDKSFTESNSQKIISFCDAATATFDEYAKDQKEIRELNVGSYGMKMENSALVSMSCEEKRVIIYKKIALASR